MSMSPMGILPVNEVLDQAAGAPPALQGLSERFEHLLNRTPNGNAHDTAVGAVSPLSHFVHAQETMMQDTFAKVRQFTVDAPSMDMNTLAASQISLGYQVANMSLQFNAGVQMAQSTKSGMQTLMKNQ